MNYVVTYKVKDFNSGFSHDGDAWYSEKKVDIVVFTSSAEAALAMAVRHSEIIYGNQKCVSFKARRLENKS